MNSILFIKICFICISTFNALSISKLDISTHVQVNNGRPFTTALGAKGDKFTDESFPSGGPLLREKRAVVSCTVPANWPSLITELNSLLDTTTVMALSPQQPRLPPLPTNQPAVCPGVNDTWWPGSTDNLRSTCPWIYKDVDLGESFYPRFIREAECMCPFCINANALGCQKMRQEITVFQIGSCRDGLSKMTLVKKTISVACYCTANTVQLSVANGPTPTQ